MDGNGAAESARNVNSRRMQVQMQSGPVQQGQSAYRGPFDHAQGRPEETRMGGESDADLLVYMSMGKEDLAASTAAWEEFYSRFDGLDETPYLLPVQWPILGPAALSPCETSMKRTTDSQ